MNLPYSNIMQKLEMLLEWVVVLMCFILIFRGGFSVGVKIASVCLLLVLVIVKLLVIS